jgi:hypothetical protein
VGVLGIVQPFSVFSPAYPIAKPLPYFLIIFNRSPQTLINALLHTKAEAPIAVFYPKLVDGSQVLAGEFSILSLSLILELICFGGIKGSIGFLYFERQGNSPVSIA